MRSFVRLLALSFALVVSASSGAEAQAITFKIDSTSFAKCPKDKQGQRHCTHVQFVSDAPLETITGVSTSVSGEITVDPAKASEGKAKIEVDVASINTSVDLRDEHLRSDKWLDAAKFPKATFQITSVSFASLKPNDVVEGVVKGKFTIHGVTKPVSAKVKVRYTPAADGKPATLRILGGFNVKLEDHKVSIPTIVALKVAKEVTVNVDIQATAK
jgi:polyisoprenoid-binding protein YceI